MRVRGVEFRPDVAGADSAAMTCEKQFLPIWKTSLGFIGVQRPLERLESRRFAIGHGIQFPENGRNLEGKSNCLHSLGESFSESA